MDELLDDLLLDYQVNGKAVPFAKNIVENHLRPYFGRRRAASIGTDDIKRYVLFRRSTNQGTFRYRGRRSEPVPKCVRPAANATINRELALLKRAFHLGLRQTPPKVERVPYIPMLEEDNVRKGFFEHHEFLALRAALPEHLRPLLTFAYYTGCLRGEILNLRWSQVDLLERVVRLEPGTTKNDEARILPLTEGLFQVLSMQKLIRDTKYPDCPWVFFNESGEQIGSFRRSWQAACKAAGLVGEDGQPNRLFHDLRRSGVRNLVRAGVSEAVAMRISGHKTRAVFGRYNIVGERDLHEAARRLESYVRERELASTGQNLGTIGPAAEGEEGGGFGKLLEGKKKDWLGGRDSNPDKQIQSLLSYH